MRAFFCARSSCGEDATGEAAEVAFPGDVGGAVVREGGPEHAAPEEEDQEGEEDGGEAAFEDAGEEEEAEVGEDDAAGADVDGIAAADEPGAQAGGQSAEDGDFPEGGFALEDEQPAEEEDAHGVAGDVRPGGVKEGGEEDAGEAVEGSGDDAVAGERAVEEERVDEPDGPDDCEERAEGDGAAAQGEGEGGIGCGLEVGGWCEVEVHEGGF